MALEPTITQRQNITAGVSTTYTGEIFTCTPTSPVSNGGALFVAKSGTATANQCIFDANTGSSGGAVYITAASKVNVDGSTFSNNFASVSGGAINNADTSDQNYDSVLMVGNTASGGSGGGLCGRTIKIKSSTASGNYAKSAGGGIYAAVRMPVASGLVITNNVASSGGGIYVDKHASLSHITLSGSTVAGNTAANNGGGILSYVGGALTASVTKSLISGNLAGSNGGGVYVTRSTTTNTSKLSVASSVISGNSAGTNGGGIFAANLTSATVSGSTVSGNTVNSTAGCAALSGGAGLYFSGVASATVNNSLVEGNRIIGDSKAEGKGAGLAAGGAVLINGSTFSRNLTDGAKGGGAVYSQTANLDARATRFTGNTAYNGGGIWFNGASKNLSVSNSIFENNYAKSQGGAIYISGAASTLISGCTFSGNRAADAGGAIYSGADFTVANSSFLTVKDTIYFASLRTMTLQGTNLFNAGIAGTGKVIASGSTMTFENTAAVNVASVITVDAATAVNFNGAEAVNFTGTQDFSGVSISVSRALTGAEAENSYSIAKGTFGFDGNKEFTIIDSVTANAYTVKIGEKAGNTGYTLKYTDNELYLVQKEGDEEPSNTVTTADDVVDKRDYVISLREAAVTYAPESGVTPVTFDSNLTETIVCNSVLVLTKETSFTGNGKDQTVLTLRLTDKQAFSAANLTFRNSSTGNAGGAVYGSSNLTFTDVDFVENTSSSGGAVYSGMSANNEKLTFTRTTFTGNSASGNGGAVYVLSNSGLTGCGAEIADSTVSGNRGGAGGGFYFYRVDAVTVSNSAFTGNSVSGNGGALLFSTVKDAKIINTGFSGNTAGGNGGAIHNVTNTKLQITGSTFSGNFSAVKGGAINNAAVLTVENCLFDGNQSPLGGAICNSGTLTIKDSRFLAESDTIYSTGTLTLIGSLEFAGDVYSSENIDVTGCTAITLNDASITVNSGLTQDLSGVAITVNGTAPGAEGKVVLSGFFSFAENQTFTVYGKENVKIGEIFTAEDKNYSLQNTVKGLEVRYEAATAANAGSIIDDTYLVDGEYAAKWNADTAISGTVYASGNNTDTNVTLQIDGLNNAEKTNCIFAGNSTGERSADTAVQLLSGNNCYVFGGGAAGSTVSGTTQVELQGGSVQQLFGAGQGFVTEEGYTEVNLLGGTVTGMVYGGGLNTDVAGTIKLNLSSGLVGADGAENAVVGGSRISGGTHSAGNVNVSVWEGFSMNTGKSSIYGAGMALYGGILNVKNVGTGAEDVRTVKINVSGGDLGGVEAGYGIFGGGLASGEGSAINADNVVINVNDGTLGNIYGGGWAQQSAEVNVTNVTINVKGGEGKGFIYGGGAHSNASNSNTTVGNVNINISAASGFTTIYAGGQIDTTVKNDAGASVGKDSVTNATISITGSYDITSNLCGQGYQGSRTVSNDNSGLLFNGFTGSVKSTVADFDRVVIRGNAAVDFTEARLNDQQNGWVLDFAGRTAANAAKTAAVFDDVFGKFSLQTNTDLLNADSWQIFSAGVSSFDDDWAMNISYGTDAAQSVKLGGEVSLGGFDWVLDGVDSNDDSPSKLVTLSKKTTPAI